MYPTPPAPQPKSRTGLWIGLACGCIALLVLVVGGVGAGIWFMNRGEDPDSTGRETTSEEETTSDEETTDEETTEEETTEEETTAAEEVTVTLAVMDSAEGNTLTTDDGDQTSTNGKYVGVYISLYNEGDSSVSFASSDFTLYDADGSPYTPIYGNFSSSGPEVAAGEEQYGWIYVDVAEDVTITEIAYTDVVGTLGQEIRQPVS